MRVSEAVLHLDDEHEATRDAALAALLKDKPAAVSSLVHALAQPMPRRRFLAAVKLLGAFGGVGGVPRLLDALERQPLDAEQRTAVVDSLAELAGPFIAGMLGRSLRLTESEGLARFRRQALALTSDLMPAVRLQALAILEHIADAADLGGTVAVRLEVLAARDDDARVRVRAASLKGRLASPAASTVGASIVAPSPPVPEGALAIDLEALVAEHGRSSSAASPSLASSSGGSSPIPPGAVAIDLEALVAAQPSPAPTELSADERLLRRLRDQRWSERQSAVDAVVARGRDLVPSLMERLGTDPAARVGICLALSRLQAPEAASALLMVATGDAPTQEARDLQAVALKALAHSLTGTEEGVASALLPLLKSPDPFVRSGAVVCLGRLADRVGARAATLLLAQDPHPEVKKAAAIAISESVRDDHIELVLPLLAILVDIPSPPAEGVEAILIALTRIEWAEPAVTVRVRHRVRRCIFGITAAQRRLAITVLERCYQDDDPPPPWVVDDVLSRLADPAKDVRVIAAAFVARFLEAGHVDAVRRLEDALERGEPEVSLLVCEALRRHHTTLAKAALEAVVASEPDPVVMQRARELLAGFTPSASEWSFDASAPAAAPATSAASASGPRPRRVRPANDDHDVVSAKDPQT
jgi:HEAT repeat protein